MTADNVETPEGELAYSLPWQAEQWQSMLDLQGGDRMPHALLLNGSSGIGKARFALALAHYLMCAQPQAGIACGQCRQCGFNKAQTHPDLKLLAPAETGKQIKIDQIREVVDFLSQTSQQGGYKVMIVAPADAMNINAANGLLKSLEEPTPRTVLILVTDSPARLLPTIRSRCRSLPFPMPAQAEALKWLTTLVPAQVSAGTLLEEAGGQPLAALALLQSDTTAIREQLSNDFLALLAGRESPLSVAQKWQAHDFAATLMWLSRRLQQLIQYRMAGVQSGLDQNWQRASGGAGVQALFALMDKVQLLHHQLRRGGNPNRQLALEELLLDTCDIFTAQK